MNVGKSKVMRCSSYGNGNRIHVMLNCEPLEEADCFKYLGSQVAADGGCERDVVQRMNEGYRAWGALRPRLGWMDGVMVALGNRGMTVKAARQCAKDRKECRALVHM